MGSADSRPLFLRVEAVVDPSEPPMPGQVTMAQAFHFARALARGEPERWDII